MLKISELKRIKKTCFDYIANSAIERGKISIGIRPIGLDFIEISTSNGEDCARLIANNTNKDIVPSFFLSWNDFSKICQLFDKEISITKDGNTILVSEGEAKLKFSAFSESYNVIHNFKFNFEDSLILDTKNIIMLDHHLELQKYAIWGNNLISCDGYLSIFNKLDVDFGQEPLLYTNKFPNGRWAVSKDTNMVVSEDKTVAFTNRKSNGQYPKVLLDLAQQPLSNSFICNSNLFMQKMQQCALIYDVMNIEFGNNELIISSAGIKKYEGFFETKIPVKYKKTPNRKGFKFSIKYMSKFCNCANSNGEIEIFFDDSEEVYMFRAENELYKIFGSGIGGK